MQLRLLIIPALMTTALIAQGQGFGPRRGAATTSSPKSYTPPTPEQLATRQVTQISNYLKLSGELSQLETALACTPTGTPTASTPITASTPCALSVLQIVIAANAANLKTAYATLATAVEGAGSVTNTSTPVAGVEEVNGVILAARAGAAEAVLAELNNLKFNFASAAQETGLINMLVGGGGPGFGGFGGPRGFAGPPPAGH